MTRHNHPVFTQVYRVIARVEDAGRVGEARTGVSVELAGRVLVVGLGPGEDLHHLPAAVTEVVAVEPSAPMRAASRGAVAAAEERGIAVTVLDAVGEALPLPDASVDAALLAYVMCSVDDPAAVAAEVHRVLRPGGRVAVLEHVAAQPGTWMSRAQRIASPLWPWVAGGCRCDRDTAEVLGAAGFDTGGLRREVLVNVPPVAPMLLGTAVRAEPGDS